MTFLSRFMLNPFTILNNQIVRITFILLIHLFLLAFIWSSIDALFYYQSYQVWQWSWLPLGLIYNQADFWQRIISLGYLAFAALTHPILDRLLRPDWFMRLNRRTLKNQISLQLLENADDAVIVANAATGKIINANRKACQLSGYSHADLLKHCLDQLVELGSDNDQRHEHGIKNKPLQIQDLPRMAHLLNQEGHSIPVEISYNALNVEGQSYIQGFFRDISQRLAAETALLRSEKRFRELFLSMSNAVAVYHVVAEAKDFIFSDFNPAAERIEKIKREQVIGRSVADVFPSVHKFGLWQSFVEVWQSGQPKRHPISFYQDGRISGWRENYIMKLESGEIVAIYEDFTERMSLSHALRDANEHLLTVINYAPLVLWVVDENGLFTFSRGKGLERLGLRSEDMIGKPMNQIYDHYPGLIADVGKALEGSEFFATHKINDTYFETWFKPVFDQQKKPHGVMGVSLDITERQRAQESLRSSELKYRFLYENMRDGLLTIDSLGYILQCNPEFERMFGYQFEELKKMRLKDLIPMRYRSEDRKVILQQVKVHGYSELLEREYIRHDGSILPVELRIHLISDDLGIEQGYFIVIRDASRRKAMDHKLKNYRDNLEKMVAKRTEQLRKAIFREKRLLFELHSSLRKERELIELKANFISTMSHQFRTPLTNMKSSVFLLNNYFHKMPAQERIQKLENIDLQIENLTQLLKDTLEASREGIVLVELNVSRFDILPLINQIIEQEKVVYGEKRRLEVELRTESSIVSLDYKLLSNILSNLISNAIKYSDEDGLIEIIIDCQLQSLTLCVKDYGIGISQQDQAHIFKRFSRSDLVTHYEGIGLGLAIVKEAVDKMNGDISVRSELGVGSEFYVELPFMSDKHLEGLNSYE